MGDPTEGALAVAAARLGLHKDQLLTLLPREAEVPFDSERKRMTTVHRVAISSDADRVVMNTLLPWLDDPAETGQIVFTKGAVDSLLELCPRVWNGTTSQTLDAPWLERIQRANTELASAGSSLKCQ